MNVDSESTVTPGSLKVVLQPLVCSSELHPDGCWKEKKGVTESRASKRDGGWQILATPVVKNGEVKLDLAILS